MWKCAHRWPFTAHHRQRTHVVDARPDTIWLFSRFGFNTRHKRYRTVSMNFLLCYRYIYRCTIRIRPFSCSLWTRRESNTRLNRIEYRIAALKNRSCPNRTARSVFLLNFTCWNYPTNELRTSAQTIKWSTTTIDGRRTKSFHILCALRMKGK